MNNGTIGIIGLGFVGSAIKESFPWETLILIDPDKGYNSPYADLLTCDAVFVCVPSPQREDGTCDVSILRSVLSKLRDLNYNGVIISKCTAPPDVYEQLNDCYPNLVHSPEFLTAANATADYLNSKFLIIGGRITAYVREAERVITTGLSNIQHSYLCSIGEAALAKYTINTFLATKVVFMNEIYSLSKSLNLDYEKITEMINLDPRIGSSHLQVPGPDESFGFGGACFPKDTAALLQIARQYEVEMSVLEAAVKKNTLLRLK